MKTRKILKELSRLAGRRDVRKGHKFRLEDVDPGDTSGIKSEAHALKLLSRSTEMLSHMQEKLYAQDRWALLLIFQGMDTAGKDGAIKHVMSGVNPQGCDVRSFKAPSAEELDHDFLWRTGKASVRSAGGSGSSTAPTPSRSWWSGFTGRRSRPSSCRSR